MGSSIATTTLALKLSDKATAPIQVAMNRINKSTRQTSDSLQRLGTIARAAFAGWGIYKVAEGMKDLVLSGARYETLGVAFRTVGANAGYSAQQMTEFQAGLESAGISMSGARQSLARMAQAQLDLTKSTKLARVAQDTAVIGAINSTEAYDRLVYGIQSAQVKVLRTIGLNVSFENSYQKVAKQLGVTANSFSQAQKASIRLNAVLEAGERISGTYQAAMETAGKQLLSLERHFDNLKVLAGAAFTPALAEIVEHITHSVKGLNNELSGEGAIKAREWGVGLRISLINVEMEIMKVAMLLDKLGGSMTTVMTGLFAFGNAIGNENSQKQYTKWMKQNLEYSKRYWQTTIDLVALEEKKLALSYSLTVAGRKEAKAKTDALERARLAAAAEFAALVTSEASTEAVAKENAALEKVNKELDKYYDKLAKSRKQIELFFRVELNSDTYLKSVEKLKVQYEKLEKQIYETFAGNELQANIARLSEWYSIEFGKIDDGWQALQGKIEGFSFAGQSFGNELADSINNAAISMQSLNEMFATHVLLQNELNAMPDGSEKFALQESLNEKFFKNQIIGYRQMFGSVSQLFKENSSEREALHKIEMGFAVIELAMSAKKIAMDAAGTVSALANSAVRCVAWGKEAIAAAVAGIAGQATGDPWSAFPRIAAMIALMGSVLAMGGVSFGGGSKGSYSGGAQAKTTGTVLGDPTKSSKSVENSWDMMEEFHAEDYKELCGIHQVLRQLNQNITGLVTGIVRSFDDFSGDQFKEVFGKQSNEMIKAFEWITDIVTLPLDLGGKIIDTVTSWITDLAGKIGVWIFGGKVKVRVTGAGIALGEAIVGDILEGIEVSVRAYYNIYKKTSGGLLGSTKRKRWTEYEEVDDDIKRLFNDIYNNLSEMLVQLGEGFDLTAKQMEEVFAYTFPAVKLDFKNLTGEEISKKINDWISTTGDEAVKALFSDIVGKYQQLDEGMMETAIRLLTQKEIMLEVLSTLNIGIEDLKDSLESAGVSLIDFTQELINFGTSFEDIIDSISTYYEQFFNDAEKYSDLRKHLEGMLGESDIDFPTNREAYRGLVESLDLTTEAGKTAFIALMELAEAADKYYDQLEDQILGMADIKQQHEDYGKTALEAFYDAHPELSDITTYEQWAAVNAGDLEEWSLTMLEEWRLLGELLESQWEEMQQTLKDIAEEDSKVQAGQKAALERMAVNFDKAADALSDYQEELLGGPGGMLTPDVQYAQARSQLDAAMQDLYSKDEDKALAATQELPGYIRQFLEASKTFSATPEQYMADFAKAMAMMNTAQELSANWADKMRLQATYSEASRRVSGGGGTTSSSDAWPGPWIGIGGYNPKDYTRPWIGIGGYNPMASGGIVSGPDSGYSAPITFHGAEYIVSGDQMVDVKNLLKKVKEVLIQVRDTNGDQNKTNKKLYRIIDKVSQGEEYLMTKAV